MPSGKQHLTKTVRQPAVSRTDAGAVFDFVSMLAHDLESPLVSMKYTLAMIRSGAFDPSNAAHQRLLNSASVAMERAETIVADILAVAKFESAEMQVELQKVNLFEIVSKAVDVAAGVAAEYKTTLQLDPVSSNHKSVTVQADPGLLGRLLDNLIYNAIRHTPQNETIHVEITTLGAKIAVAVIDSGEGLGDVRPEHLFEKFVQATTRKKGNHRGVGLGLYFCRLAAEAMGAVIFAENVTDGGARFGVAFDS